MKRKLQRLKDYEIRKFFRTRIVIKRAGLKVFVKPQKEEYPRFAVIVPKTFDKKATARHRIERQIRASISSFYTKIPQIDFIIMVNKGVLRYDFKTLKRILGKILLKQP